MLKKMVEFAKLQIKCETWAIYKTLRYVTAFITEHAGHTCNSKEDSMIFFIR